MLTAFIMRWFGIRYVRPGIVGLAGNETPTAKLNLQPGDWVRVRSKDEIARTLNSDRRNRGMWFDAEMVVYCGKGPFRVLQRVKIVNEKSGELMNLKNPCIILEGVTCNGNYLHRRMFSPRNGYPFWREIWLELGRTEITLVLSVDYFDRWPALEPPLINEITVSLDTYKEIHGTVKC